MVQHSLAACCLVFAMAMTASAQDARTLFQQGRAQYESGDYESALESWESAYEADPRPLIQYNMSQAYERLGRLTDAVRVLDSFLEQAPDHEQSTAARARVAELRSRLERTAIVIVGGEEGATVLIDGEDRGRLPHPDPFRVEPGSHDVVVRPVGGPEFRAAVAVSGGQQAQIQVSGEGSSGNAMRTAGWALTGGGGGLALIGGIVGGLAIGKMKSAETADDPETDSARTFALTADILIFTGAAAAATGIVLLVVDALSGDDESATARPMILPTISDSSVGASVVVPL